MDITRLYALVVFLCSLPICHSAGKDHPVPSYFRNTDADGNLLHREEESYDAVLPKPFVTHISREDSGSILKASPITVENGGIVNVTWQNIINPQEKDFIAFYCPVDDSPTHYLDYFFVTVSKTWSLGYGGKQVTVYNMRTNCVFKYFRSIGYSQLVTVSNELSFTGAPLQGHIALTGNPSEIRVMWTSGKGNEAAVVRYGLSTSMSQSVYKVDIKTYSASDMCESPANSSGFWNPGFIYDVLLSDLRPNMKYYYSFGTKDHMSAMFYFQTALPAGDPTSYKFIAYGDMGIAPYSAVPTSELIQSQVKQDESLRFVLHNGDISYAEGHAYIWDQWMTLIEPYATLLPYMIGIGNHEQDHVTGGIKHDPSGAKGDGGFRPRWGNNGQDSGGECGVPMFKRFHMPDNGNAVWWYSFDYGLVHYIMMSTEHDFTPGSRQYTWLENDLKSVDREKTPWLIFSGHRAMYCSSLYIDNYVIALNMQRLFEDLLHKYKVDLALWSHYHSYERTCKVYKNQCRDDGIIHIVVGSAGKKIDLDIWFDKPWSMFHQNEYGYGVVTVANATAMKWEWIQNNKKKSMDSVWIIK